MIGRVAIACSIVGVLRAALAFRRDVHAALIDSVCPSQAELDAMIAAGWKDWLTD